MSSIKYEKLPCGHPGGHDHVFNVRKQTNGVKITFAVIFRFVYGSGFNNLNYLEIKQDLISKFLAPIIQNILIGNFQTS